MVWIISRLVEMEVIFNTARTPLSPVVMPVLLGVKGVLVLVKAKKQTMNVSENNHGISFVHMYAHFGCCYCR